MQDVHSIEGMYFRLSCRNTQRRVSACNPVSALSTKAPQSPLLMDLWQTSKSNVDLERVENYQNAANRSVNWYSYTNEDSSL